MRSRDGTAKYASLNSAMNPAIAWNDPTSTSMTPANRIHPTQPDGSVPALRAEVVRVSVMGAPSPLSVVSTGSPERDALGRAQPVQPQLVDDEKPRDQQEAEEAHVDQQQQQHCGDDTADAQRVIVRAHP